MFVAAAATVILASGGAAAGLVIGAYAVYVGSAIGALMLMHGDSKLDNSVSKMDATKNRLQGYINQIEMFDK